MVSSTAALQYMKTSSFSSLNPCSLKAAGQKWVINLKLQPFTMFILIKSHVNDTRLTENNHLHLYTNQTAPLLLCSDSLYKRRRITRAL